MDAANEQFNERAARLRRLNVARVLRHRRRKRERVHLLQIEIADDDIAGFVSLGVLSPEQRDDPEAIRHALAVLCRLGCQHWPEKAR